MLLARPLIGGGGTQALGNLRELATDVPGGAIDHRGHWVPEEQPEGLAKALLDFFAAA